jgi:uncharacterized protein YfaS (alpha-2-macroglobulin family)
MTRHFILSVFTIILSLLLLSNSCEKEKSKNNETEAEKSTDLGVGKKEAPKEKISYTFNGDFKSLWIEVDSLERNGLYASALAKVQTIFDSAQKEKNAPQVVKSIMFKMKYNSYLKEDDYILSISELNNIADNSSFPINQIVHSVTAEVYWGYYQTNRWRFMKRTQTVAFKNDDLRTWDLTKIIDHVNKHHNLALTNADSLQRTNIGDFKEMLQYFGQSDKLRPTLYDLLAHRALDFFETTEAGLTRPADKFIVQGANYFGDNLSFLKVSTTSKDTMSNALHAVRIFKDLTLFHKDDSQSDALVDLDLRRLKFARNTSIDIDKNQWYENALIKLGSKYNSNACYAEIQHKLASYYVELGNSYSKATPENRFKKKEAFDICVEAISRFPESYGAKLCINLKETIEEKSIAFEMESTFAPNRTERIKLNYQNLNQVYFKIVKVDWDYFLKNEFYGEDLVADLLKHTQIEAWDKKLNNPGDFQKHSVELTVTPTEKGQYVILCSPHADFRLNENAIAYSPFWVSDISYTYRNNGDQSYDVFVTNRETGEPIKDVNASIYINKYSYVTRTYHITKQESYKSDANGMFTIRSKSEYRNIYIDLSKGNDRYNNGSQLYQYKDYQNNKPTSTTHFFIDRGIYRPGQTVHFKGIRLNHSGDNHTLGTGKMSLVTMYDANGQKVSDLKLTTNDFGTFSGSFTVPLTGITGQMRISDAYGSKYFSVEEYKRPKFEVEFKPIIGVYKIGQKVSITGTAKSFAGANVDGADVQYRITRTSSFPSWSWYRWGYSPQGSALVIENGNIKTDENGEFIIEFEAKEDPSIDKKFYPSYTYSINADVTDMNGETRSSQQSVRVGFTAMHLSLGIPSEIDRSDKNLFRVTTSNLNGQDVDAKGNVRVTKLIEPETVFRSALWEKPDMQEISKEDYAKLFPHDPYENENEIANYPKGAVVLDVPFNTGLIDSIEFTSMKNWEPGRYVVEASAIDEFGETVTDVRYMIINDQKSERNAVNEIWSFTPLKMFCEPGEKAEFLIASAATDLKVLYELEHKGIIIKREIITLSRSQKKISIPIEEKHRGNLTIHLAAVKYGREHHIDQPIIVPFTNKTLDVSFETFRDKLQPGQKEEWKVKIKGPKGEKVVAEMLAAMYDASLDEFTANSFYMNIFNSNYSERYWDGSGFGKEQSTIYYNYFNKYSYYQTRSYDNLNWWGYNNNYYTYRNIYNRGGLDFGESDFEQGALMMDAVSETRLVAGFAGEREEKNLESVVVASKSRTKNSKDDQSIAPGVYGNSLGDGKLAESDNRAGKLGSIKARSNLSETAFFFPQLKTNENGEIILSFTVPESLTSWKFLSLAHTKDLKTGYLQKEIVTQKELMVVPNAPRFMREGDKMTFTAKVSNLSEGDLSGNAQLMLFDATTMKPIDALFKNTNAIIDFSAKKGQSARLAWDIEVPFGIGAITYRVVASAGNFTDGEEMALPILSNRMLVTESLPLPIKGIGTKDFTFTKLVNSDASSSLKHHKLTLEYTSNPAWYAIQAMPYMMEYPHECAEQLFTRFYANSLAFNIVNSSPKIKEVFDSWKESSPEAFLSNLEKNQELKSLMLEETPWVLEAKDESERKKRIALLFDLNKMGNELDQNLRKLERIQVSNGGFPWFPGMEDNTYITQHIITGMGHLDHLGIKDVRENQRVWKMVKNGVNYLDERIIENYNRLKALDPYYLTEQRITNLQVQYLYARSYFKDLPITPELKEAFDYYQNQASTYWLNFNLYNEGMIALQAKRYEIPALPEKIMASLKERALVHEELGMYWKDNVSGYYWYQAPIETQALLIEAFDEVSNDTQAVEELKVWLLKQKQTTDWKTTKATAEACYALLLRGTDMLTNTEMVEIKINGKVLDPEANGAKVEAGTGYFKTSWEGEAIQPELGNISITRKTEGVSWGAMYWQYFEDLDKISTHETPLKLQKQLFLVEATESGIVMRPITSETILKPGDKVRVRIELRTDRNMEYVHLKDMRAAGFEPINVFSRYKWQDGLGYYESTRDAATNFFMDFVPKGTYVFEYDLRVSHFGDFSNGIATIQSMYAPEFTSHSEGIRVVVEEKE